MTKMNEKIKKDVLIARVTEPMPPPKTRIKEVPMVTPLPKADLEADALEAAVEEAIAGCDADLRATIRALLVANQFLRGQVERLRELTSHGYTRGKLSLLDLRKGAEMASGYEESPGHEERDPTPVRVGNRGAFRGRDRRGVDLFLAGIAHGTNGAEGHAWLPPGGALDTPAGGIRHFIYA
jgi:hypothetical protein